MLITFNFSLATYYQIFKQKQIKIMQYIEIETPKSINKITAKIEMLLKSGVKTNEINLICLFVASDKVMNEIYDSFRKTKNRIAFNLNN